MDSFNELVCFQENPKVKDSKNKKKKERKKNEDKSDQSSGADAKPSENEYIDEASQVVMENTGCQVK